MNLDSQFVFRLAASERLKVERLARRWRMTPGKVLRTLIRQADERRKLEAEPIGNEAQKSKGQQ